MNKLFLALFTLSIPFAIAAQPAVYENGVLSIPQTAVIDSTGSSYFTNVQLEADANGNFSVTAGDEQSLVAIDSVSVNVMESLPVQVSVTVAGNKSVPCVQLLEAAVSRKNSQFTVVLAESTLGPAETCIAQIDPFETTVTLDVSGLSAGIYQVLVNSVSTSFELTADNG